MNNPYIENKSKKEKLDDEIKSLIEAFRKRNEKHLKQINLLEKERRAVVNLCTHEDEDGNSTWDLIGQDPGSGRSEHRCSICYKSD